MALTAAGKYDPENEGGFESGFLLQGTIAEILSLTIRGDIHIDRREVTRVLGDCSLMLSKLELIGGRTTVTVGKDMFEMCVTLRLAGDDGKARLFALDDGPVQVALARVSIFRGARPLASFSVLEVEAEIRGGKGTMTDRGTPALRQSANSFTIGPSSMRWVNGKLVIDINEISSPPLVSRVRGTITVTPSAITSVESLINALIALDSSSILSRIAFGEPRPESHLKRSNTALVPVDSFPCI